MLRHILDNTAEKRNAVGAVQPFVTTGVSYLQSIPSHQPPDIVMQVLQAF